MVNGFDDIKNDAIEQGDRPDKITRAEAEKLCRQIIRPHLGRNLPENLFQDSVNELMEEINGVTSKEE